MAKVSKGVLGKTLTALPILALALAAWFVTLAGLAVARHYNGEAGLDFLWFVWAFEGFVLFFCTLHLIEVGAGFSLAHAATSALLAVVTVLTILETEALNQSRKNNIGNGRYHKGVICAFAGFLALSILNLLLLIILGTKHNTGRSSHHKDELTMSQAHTAPVAGQTYGAAPVSNAGYGTSTVV